jgi:hypothetical protein
MGRASQLHRGTKHCGHAKKPALRKAGVSKYPRRDMGIANLANLAHGVEKTLQDIVQEDA